MCGRYRRTTREEELARRWSIPIPEQRDLPISWNVAPTSEVLAIRLKRDTKAQSFDWLRWGLIPYWSKDKRIAYSTINARAETIDKTPVFRQAFQKRRCLIPADGFYEWRKTRPPKVPFHIALKDESPFCFAGVWEAWKDPSTGEWLRSCSIITTEANELVAQIHDRMPVILRESDFATWLGDTRETDLKLLLRPYPPEVMQKWEISLRVNSAANNDPAIIDPIPLMS
jgi:putative SOS response-associated peptidase YedK